MKTTTLRSLSYVVLVLGLLLVLGGVSLFVAANGPRDRAYTFSLPSQANRYQRIQVSILTAGSIDVTYQSDYVITVWVMTESLGHHPDRDHVVGLIRHVDRPGGEDADLDALVAIRLAGQAERVRAIPWPVRCHKEAHAAE